MKILITGYAGFIGYHVCKKLIERGDELVGIDNLNTFYDHQIKRNRHKKLEGKISGYEHSILDIGSIDKIFDEDIDAVIHLAAYAGVRTSLENPALYWFTNVIGTLNIIELCKKNGIKNMVNVSSSSVYGENAVAAERGLREDEMAAWPVSPYASSKRAAELMCENANQHFGMNISSLRFFTVYGPEQRPDLAIYKFVKAGIEGTKIQVYDNYDTRRDYTYVEDIADGIIATMEYNKQNKGTVFNLGGGYPISMRNLIDDIEDELDTVLDKELIGAQPGDVRYTWADITRARNLLNWEPKTNFSTGIKKFISWARSSL